MTDEIEAYIAGVVGVVEANSFEHMCLWGAHTTKETWKEARSGFGEIVGHLADMPVHLSLLVDEIDGHKILFIDPTSQVVDHRLIEAWLAEKMPATARRENGSVIKVDAMNFHNVFPRKAAA